MESDDLLHEVKCLSRTRRICTYYRVDLHIHSPASSDYWGDSQISPYDFISNFASRGFDLIAITDHNSGAYIDKATTARNQLAESEGKNIAVLPGVELSVSPGVHLLAILPDGGSKAVSDLLSSLQFPIQHHGDSTKLVDKPIGEIARAVHERNGLLVGAHCNSTNGVVEELSGETRIEWIDALDALEFNSSSSSEKISRTINYITNELNLSTAFTYGSDSHDAASENTGMWVKMASPSLASLNQLVFEPELRVRRTPPSDPSHGRIIGFTTTQGVYPLERFRFSPSLNVIVGGRGAGKSAAIDLLRFAFEAEPRDDDAGAGIFANRIAGFLQGVGEVVVAVKASDGETYVVARSGSYEIPNSRSGPTFQDQSYVYQVSDRTLIPRDIRPSEILGIEFYGQGEVARLADRVDEQLRLIDENLDHTEASSSIVESQRQLEAGEGQLLELMQTLERLQAEAAKRPELEDRKDRLAEFLEDPVFLQRTQWDREREWLDRQQEWLQSLHHELPESLPGRIDIGIDIESSPAKAVLEKVRDTTDRFHRDAQSDLTSCWRNLNDAISGLAELRTEWNTAFDIAERKYRARLTELGAADLAQPAAEQRSVDKELSRLTIEVEPKILKLKSTIESLATQRSELLADLTSSRLAILQTRTGFVDQLNSRLAGKVIVDLSRRDTSLYFQQIDGPLHGSGMMYREDQIQRVCESLTPKDFVKAVRSNSNEELIDVGVTDNNASRMRNSLTEEDLYKIERVDIPPLPTIRIRREGEDDYTDLTSLSVGEKCSAILSIALLSKEKPLVIDQPEDDLDHAFIIDSIVEGIRGAKSERQIIAATHNPNIPVLGDAEMVFRVARLAGKDVCRIQASGGLELPQVTIEVQGLEGGAEAFERRRQRYSGVP